MAKIKENEIIDLNEIDKILKNRFSKLKNEIADYSNKKQEELNNISKELEVLSDSISTINKINSEEIKWLQKDLSEKIAETLKKIFSETKNFNLYKLIFKKNIHLNIDEFGKDPDFIKNIQPLIDYLYEKYWRVDVIGQKNLYQQKDNYILVPNHGGILPWDSIMITEAVKRNHPQGTEPRFLIEDWFIQKPFVGMFLTKMGICRGSRENAERLLAKGEIIGLFPEGIKGAIKPFSERYHLQRFGRGGAIKTAIKNRKKIVPVAVIGSDEIYPTITHLMIQSRILNLPYLPITPTFPFLGPLGFLPLPVKWTIHFGEPIPYDEFPLNTIENEIIINTLNEELRNTIQNMITEMIKNRRSIFLG